MVYLLWKDSSILNKHVSSVGCGWQFDWIRVGFLSSKGAIRNIMQNFTISSNVNEYIIYVFIISVQTSITKTCEIPCGCKPFGTIHNQMRCPCSIHFFLPFDHDWQGINPSQATLTKRNRDVWCPIPPQKNGVSKSLELFTSLSFQIQTEEPWNQRFCRQNPRNPRRLVSNTWWLMAGAEGVGQVEVVE